MIGAISAGLGLLQGGMSLFGNQDNSSAAAAYQNELSIRQADIINRQKERAAGRAKTATEEQVAENRDAANRAMAREQARINEQLFGFSMARNSLIKERILGEAQYNVAERYGRSAKRLRDVEIVGNYGRQNALFSENVASTGRQYRRDMEDFARNRYDADRQAVSGLSAQLDGYMPTMAQTTYNPQSSNSGLKIANAVMGGVTSGLGMFGQLGGSFGGGGKSSGGNMFDTSMLNTSLSFWGK